MINTFSIDFNWLHRDYGDAIERATLAELAITANKYSAFELEDFQTKSVRKSARLSAYHLAFWFASNWWRLRWEPERITVDWEMSHRIGAVGGGYLWPNLSFIGDGATVTVQSEPALFTATGQTIRYINNFKTVIRAEEFESEIAIFIESVIARLTELRIDAPELVGLWKEVCMERHDIALSEWRRMEAIMGFDPDEGPSYMVAGLRAAADNYGLRAVEEVAAATQEKVLDCLSSLSGAPRIESVGLCIPKYDALCEEISSVRATLFPWQLGEAAARIARRVWSLDGVVSTEAMVDTFGFRPDLINEPPKAKGPMSAGFRVKGISDHINVFLNSPYHENRRFALMRIIGDNLTAPLDDRLLPVPNIKTYRQKFQRAFAQEFLCPYEELRQFLNCAEPGDEGIEEAAHYFQVSPLLVTSVLVNKGNMDRASLDGCGSEGAAL